LARPSLENLAMSGVKTAGELAELSVQAARIAAERWLAYLRIGVMISGTVLLPLIVDRPSVIAWLAYTLLALGWAYSLGVHVLEPHRRFPILTSAWFTTISDLALTLLWIGATGGAESPWLVAVYAAIVPASLRFRPRDTLAVAGLAAAGLVGVVAAHDQLASHAALTGVAALFLVLVAATGAVIARERLGSLATQIEQLDIIQEVAQVGSWEWSLADNAVMWSQELKRILGVPADAQPTLDVFLASVHPDDRDNVQREIERALTSRTPLQFEHRIVRPNGKLRWVHCRGRIVLDELGAPERLVGSSQDITETKHIQEQLLIGSKLASLGTLASGVAHEINNPLAYVTASLELARRRLAACPPEAAQTVQSALVAARDGCQRVAAIVRGLKTFSRSDQELVGAVDLAAVADSAIAIAAHEIGQRARLVRDYQPVAKVSGNESRLLQVVLNLIVNAAHAIDASTERHHEIRVRVGTAADGRVRLDITDTGCGIPAEQLGRIFDPFFTTKRPGVGTGLGLAICDGIVQDLGGEILVDTRVGIGTTFSVLLPAASVETSAGAPAAPPRRRVLVIEPAGATAGSLAGQLERMHDVTTAPDPGRALSLLCDGQVFDLVVCDDAVPGLAKVDLRAALTSLQPDNPARLVLVTSADRGAPPAESDPHVRYLPRPLDAAALARVLDDLAPGAVTVARPSAGALISAA
jgi:PAS domain S-box-containing protein